MIVIGLSILELEGQNENMNAYPRIFIYWQAW